MSVSESMFSELMSRIINFHESETRSDGEIIELEGALKGLLSNVWENGLEPDYLDCLVRIFCSTQLDLRKNKLLVTTQIKTRNVHGHDAGNCLSLRSLSNLPETILCKGEDVILFKIITKLVIEGSSNAWGLTEGGGSCLTCYTGIAHESTSTGVTLLIFQNSGRKPAENNCMTLVQLFATDRDCRCIILDCLVPQTKVSVESSQKLVLWVLTQSVKLEEECSQVLRWLKVMIRYDLVDVDSVQRFYNMLLKYLIYPSLVKELSEILCLLLKPEFVTELNCRLVEIHYEQHGSDHFIGRLLWEFAQYAPHIVPKEFHFCKPHVWDKERVSNFETVVKTQAARAGFAKTRLSCSQRVTFGLPCPEYDERKKKNTADVVRIGDINSMFELGRALERLELPLNEVSLLQCEEGIMNIVVNGPSPQFLCSLNAELGNPKLMQKAELDALIMSISGLQDLLSYGLPPVTVFLSDFLANWDGEYKEEYVYSLLPRVYFNTFSELKELILVPLTRVFVTDTAETKVKILDGLLLLLTNVIALYRSDGTRWCRSIPTPKWTEDIEGTTSRLVEYINQLWNHGVTLEGQECTHLVLHAVLFYKNLNTLISKCHFPSFWVIHPSLSHPALLSKNFVILDELCTLILSYKKDIIPQFERVGLLGEFESQVETVMALADSTFKYLWESVGGERPDNFHTTSDEFTPSSSIGFNHMALHPIVCTLCKQLGRDLNSMSKNDLMTLMSTFMKGVAEFIKHEELEQLA